MRYRVFNAPIVTYIATWLSIVAASALTVIPPTFEQMAVRADLVFMGKVVGSRSEWRTNGTQRAIFTLVDFQTQEVLKGKAGKSVTLQFLGGTVEDTTLEVPGVPKFSVGERVLLFVEGNGVQFCPIAGVFHGKFGIGKDQRSGREIVLMHNGKPLRDVSEIGTDQGAELGLNQGTRSIPADRQPMSVEEFKQKLQEQLAKKVGR